MTPRHPAVTSALVALYPPSWRGRYGAEIRALIDETGVTPRTAVDLVRGAASAWLFPRGVEQCERRWRLEATVCTCGAAWAVALLGMAGFSRGVDDSPLPGLDTPVASAAFRTSETAFTISIAVVVLAVLFYGAIVFAPAVLCHRGAIIRPVAIPLSAAALWISVSVGMGWLIPRLMGSGGPHDARLILGIGLLLLAWAAAGGLILMGCAAGGGMALRRAHLGERLLLPGAAAGVVIAASTLVSSVAAAVCLVALGQQGRVSGLDLTTPIAAATLVLAAAAVALTAAGRAATAMSGALRRG